MTISDPLSLAKVQVLRDTREQLNDDLRNFSTLIHSLRTAMIAQGSIKGGFGRTGIIAMIEEQSKEVIELPKLGQGVC